MVLYKGSNPVFLQEIKGSYRCVVDLTVEEAERVRHVGCEAARHVVVSAVSVLRSPRPGGGWEGKWYVVNSRNL